MYKIRPEAMVKSGVLCRVGICFVAAALSWWEVLINGWCYAPISETAVGLPACWNSSHSDWRSTRGGRLESSKCFHQETILGSKYSAKVEVETVLMDSSHDRVGSQAQLRCQGVYRTAGWNHR